MPVPIILDSTDTIKTLSLHVCVSITAVLDSCFHMPIMLIIPWFAYAIGLISGCGTASN